MRHPFVFTQTLTGLAAAVGGLGTRPDTEWYRALEKPPWQPPAQAFGLVWTPVYGLIALGDRAVATGRRRRRPASAAGAGHRQPERQRGDRVAAAALTPYVVWTLFATALNAELWRRNR